VCFPMSMEAKDTKGIDFETLEEYVRDENEKRLKESKIRKRRRCESVGNAFDNNMSKGLRHTNQAYKVSVELNRLISR
jgi:hypothetical protein